MKAEEFPDRRGPPREGSESTAFPLTRICRNSDSFKADSLEAMGSQIDSSGRSDTTELVEKQMRSRATGIV